jgi:hypothetical protein
MDSHDVADMYEKDMYETKIKTNTQFIDELENIRTSLKIEFLEEKNDTIDVINTLITKYDKECDKAKENFELYYSHLTDDEINKTEYYKRKEDKYND